VSRRGYAILLLLGVGLLGGMLAVAQERAPWPARPIVPPDDELPIPRPGRAVQPPPPPKAEVRSPAPGLPSHHDGPAFEPTVAVPAMHSSPPLISQAPAAPAGPAAPPELTPSPPALNEGPSPVPAPFAPGVDIPAAPQPKSNGGPHPGGPNALPLDPGLPEIPMPSAKSSEPGPAPPMFPAVPPPQKAASPPPSANNPAPTPANLDPLPPAPKHDSPLSFPPEQRPAAPQVPKNVEPTKPPALRVVAASRRPQGLPPALTEAAAQSSSYRPPLATSQGPSTLSVHKRGPGSASVGQPVSYEITVRNEGAGVAERVRIEDEVPRGARFLRALPQTSVQGDRLAWLLDALPPGREMRFIVELEPTAAGEMVSTASVVLASSTVRTQIVAASVPQGGAASAPSTAPTTQGSGPIAQGSLTLSVAGPTQSAIGQPVELEIRMFNQSGQTLSGLGLRARLPAGLQTAWGSDVEADIGDLVPGAVKNIKLPARAAQAGRHVVDVSILSAGSSLAHAQAVIVVGHAGLGLRYGEGTHLVLDRANELRLEVGNYQSTPARNVVVTQTLPAGIDFLSASDRGTYRPETRTINWVLDTLEAGQAKALVVRIQPKVPGQRECQAVARTQAGDEARTNATLTIGGLPALGLQISDRDDPLEVGKETVYEIRVANQGTAPDSDIHLEVTLPHGLAFRNAAGPTAYRAQGQRIVFGPLPRLDPKREAVYQVVVQAQSPGTLRVRAQVSSALSRTPVAREERTMVYQD
jgi:uncharacterized repeat protein (TIGR01451 family)